MKILVVSQYFWPEEFRINDLASELVKRGHEVTVLTGKPNYPDGQVYSEFKKNPAAFGRYKGTRVIRVPMVPRGKGRSLLLIFNYLSFAASAALWGWLKLRKDKFDVIFVFEPSPITVGLPAVFLKKNLAVPVVFWVLDLWPETLEAIGVVKSRFLLKKVGKLVSFVYNRCDLVLGQSRSFLTEIAKYCNDPEKIKYFPSWSEDLFSKPGSDVIEEFTGNDGQFKVLFAGNIGEAQDFPSIIRAAEILKSKSAKIKIFIIGDGRMLPWLERQIVERGLQDYVLLLGRHPLERMPDFYASADALLVCLKENKVFSMTIPGKLQTYMMAGKPILAMLDGEGAQAVDRAKAGFTCNSESFDMLADNMISMSKLSHGDLQKLGDNARNYALDEFNREALITQLEQWFAHLAGRDINCRVSE